MPSQRVPLEVEEQELYSGYMLNNKAPYPLSPTQPGQPSRLAQSCDYLGIMTTFR